MPEGLITAPLPETPGTGRLGRHLEHDPRSRDYGFTAEGFPPPRTVVWPRYGDILDQGDLGCCTGAAMAGWLASAPHATPASGPSVTMDNALALYEAATRLDQVPGEYPPDDTGSTGIAVCKAAQRSGYINGYSWAFSLRSLLTALTHGPVLIGSVWTDGMDTPDAFGRVRVVGEVRGGHEYLCRGVEYRSTGEILLHCDNSWGPGWGLNGSFIIPLVEWVKLREQRADVAVPHP